MTSALSDALGIRVSRVPRAVVIVRLTFRVGRALHQGAISGMRSSASAVPAVAARRVDGAGPGSLPPWWRQTGCAHHPAQELAQDQVDQLQRHQPIMPGTRCRPSSRSRAVCTVRAPTRRCQRRTVPGVTKAMAPQCSGQLSDEGGEEHLARLERGLELVQPSTATSCAGRGARRPVAASFDPGSFLLELDRPVVEYLHLARVEVVLRFLALESGEVIADHPHCVVGDVDLGVGEGVGSGIGRPRSGRRPLCTRCPGAPGR